jgi:hypothetical protein
MVQRQFWLHLFEAAKGALFAGSSPLLALLSFAENQKGSSIRGVSRPHQILNAAHRDCQDLAID